MSGSPVCQVIRQSRPFYKDNQNCHRRLIKCMCFGSPSCCHCCWGLVEAMSGERGQREEKVATGTLPRVLQGLEPIVGKKGFSSLTPGVLLC